VERGNLSVGDRVSFKFWNSTKTGFMKATGVILSFKEKSVEVEFQNKNGKVVKYMKLDKLEKE
jgi:hypothetical protein